MTSSFVLRPAGGSTEVTRPNDGTVKRRFRLQVDVLSRTSEVSEPDSDVSVSRAMASRRPDSFDGLGYRGREEPLYGSGFPLRCASADPQQHQWVTTPPDIPGSRNLHPGERTPLLDGPQPEPRTDWGGPQPGLPPSGRTRAHLRGEGLSGWQRSSVSDVRFWTERF